MFFTYYGGIHRVFDMIERGWHPDTFSEFDSLLLLRFRQFLSIVFWINLLLCISLPLIRVRQQVKHKVAAICLLVLLSLWILPWIVKWLIF